MINILLVDDERFLLNAISRFLRPTEYAVYAVEDALEAQYVLKSRSIDVVVSDHKMPGMCGVELLGWTARTFPDTIRILLTGYATIGILDQAINFAHIHRFLMKPCDHECLRSAIHDELRTRRSKEQKSLPGSAPS